MKRNVIVSLCVSTAFLASPNLSATASACQQPKERIAQEPAKKLASKKKLADPKITPERAAPKAPVAKNRSGKRFWSRIMNVFRDVHSAEKKQK